MAESEAAKVPRVPLSSNGRRNDAVDDSKSITPQQQSIPSSQQTHFTFDLAVNDVGCVLRDGTELVVVGDGNQNFSHLKTDGERLLWKCLGLLMAQIVVFAYFASPTISTVGMALHSYASLYLGLRQLHSWMTTGTFFALNSIQTGFVRAAWIVVVVAIVGALMPSLGRKEWVNSKMYQALGYYFDAQVYAPKDDKHSKHEKPIIMLYIPHGVVSYCAWAGATIWVPEGRDFKTAVANILNYMIGVRDLFATPFGFISASRSSLIRILANGRTPVNNRGDVRETASATSNKMSVSPSSETIASNRDIGDEDGEFTRVKNSRMTDLCLYPGGIAELMHCHMQKEQIFFGDRKGCIKLAMESGADIRVVYLFGQTQFFSLIGQRLTYSLSRKLAMSMVAFVGRWYVTIIPRYSPIRQVFGPIITMPDLRGDQEISREVVQDQHSRVMKHIKDLYDDARVLHPAYVNKELHIK